MSADLSIKGAVLGVRTGGGSLSDSSVSTDGSAGASSPEKAREASIMLAAVAAAAAEKELFDNITVHLVSERQIQLKVACRAPDGWILITTLNRRVRSTKWVDDAFDFAKDAIAVRQVAQLILNGQTQEAHIGPPKTSLELRANLKSYFDNRNYISVEEHHSGFWWICGAVPTMLTVTSERCNDAGTMDKFPILDPHGKPVLLPYDPDLVHRFVVAKGLVRRT